MSEVGVCALCGLRYGDPVNKLLQEIGRLRADLAEVARILAGSDPERVQLAWLIASGRREAAMQELADQAQQLKFGYEQSKPCERCGGRGTVLGFSEVAWGHEERPCPACRGEQNEK